MNRLSTEEFIKRAKEVHGDKYDYSKTEYINARTKICIIYPGHGEFWQKPFDHLNGHGGMKYRKHKPCDTTEQFIEKARQIHGNKYDYSKVEYVDAHTKVCIICPEHGEFWIAPNKHLNGGGCQVCGKINKSLKRMMSLDEFIEKAKLIHGDKYDYSKVDYRGNKIKVCIICPEHGEFWMTPNAHLNGQCCPNCGFSRLEMYMENLLNRLQIKYIEQARFEWLGKQSLDFYLPDYSVAIECQGGQHFYPVSKFGGYEQFLKQIELDKKKFLLCKNNNINIVYFSKNCKIKNYLNVIYTNEKDFINFISECIKQR